LPLLLLLLAPVPALKLKPRRRQQVQWWMRRQSGQRAVQVERMGAAPATAKVP
jgi:hypothetical protein